jgi:hypothetical protein
MPSITRRRCSLPPNQARPTRFSDHGIILAHRSRLMPSVEHPIPQLRPEGFLMIDAIYHADWFTHLVAALVLLSHLGDILSTRLATPTLKLEANPIMRRGGWPLVYGTLLVALVPYYSTPVGVAFIATSLFVTSSNLSRGWIAHTLGEAEYEALLLRVASRGRRALALRFVLGAAANLIFAGLLLMWLSGSAPTWTFWFGAGITFYGLAIAVHGSLFVIRLYRRAAAPSFV